MNTSTNTFPRPLSPTKNDLKPNPHPYPIKTTSTALLSRSNSTPHNTTPNPGRHHYYVPPSPTPSPSPSPSRPTPGHKYSKSLATDTPQPLPTPFPSSASPTRAGFAEDPGPPRSRLRRADTLPSTAVPHLPAAADLPANPRLWTPTQLSVHLAAALRVRSGESFRPLVRGDDAGVDGVQGDGGAGLLPARVAEDIAAFARERKITGRAFLRFTEGDLEG